MSKHVAFIPARKGSKGFKFKNRILFSHTANFINQIDWFDEVIVSSDDPVINELASQIWLFYLTVLYRSLEDFLISKKLVEVDKARSVCSFIKAKTHPYDSWLYKKDKTLTKYIDNDVYRRQDKPDAWEHYHYVCCFASDELNSLNSELIGKSTVPMFLSDETSAKLIEVDTEQDLDDWCRQYKYTGANI